VKLNSQIRKSQH